MPIHDWTKVDAGVFHHFHLRWIAALSDALNGGMLPSEYYALAEQQFGGYGPDVLALKGPSQKSDSRDVPLGHRNGNGHLVVARPATRFTMSSDRPLQGLQDELITIRHVSDDEVVSVIELVSPGNKSSQKRMRSFLEKSCELLERQIHLVIVDLFPPTKRDPNGIHATIWEDFGEKPFALPADKPLTVVSYEAATVVNAFVEPVAVGDRLPTIPLFLKPGGHIPVELETTYLRGWEHMPERWRSILEN